MPCSAKQPETDHRDERHKTHRRKNGIRSYGKSLLIRVSRDALQLLKDDNFNKLISSIVSWIKGFKDSRGQVIVTDLIQLLACRAYRSERSG